MKKGQQTVYDSMAAAARAIGVSVTLLKVAKRRGAPGFVGSRVDVERLRPWLDKANLDTPDKETIQIAKLREEVRKLKIVNDLKEGKLVAVSEVAPWAGNIFRGSLQIAEQKLLNEMPALVENLNADQIRFRARKIYDDLAASLHELIKKYA